MFGADILRGRVGVINNYNLCHMATIEWKEIMSDPNAKYIFVYNFTEPQRTCHCDKACKKGCWGEGEHNCQKFSKLTCSPQCSQGRCYGPGPRDCCHLFCAGGCTGPTQRDCLVSYFPSLLLLTLKHHPCYGSCIEFRGSRNLSRFCMKMYCIYYVSRTPFIENSSISPRPPFFKTCSIQICF